MPNISDFKVGDKAYLTKTFTQEDVDVFAELSLDKNPLHVDEEAAAQSIFGKRVVHGILQVGLISAVLGNSLPGKGAVYREQKIVFKKPAFPGDTLTAVVEVIKVVEKIGLIVCRTTIQNQNNEILVSGEAKGIVPSS